MLQAYYVERVSLKTDEAGDGDLPARASWLILQGDGAKVLASGTATGSTDFEAERVLINYGDGATAGTDPERMRRVTEIIVSNTNEPPLARTLRVYVQHATNGTRQVWRGTIPARGTVIYNGSEWVIYNEHGRRVGAGSYQPGGF